MKKILLILLAFTSFASFAQAEFPEGIQITGGQPTNTTPAFITTTAVNGLQEKIPSAYIEKTTNKQNSLAIDGTGAKFPTVDGVNSALGVVQKDIAYVDANGNDATAILGNIRKPYLTIDAALDALPSTGGIVKIGVGVFNSPTESKIKSNTAFIGSKEPITDAVMTISTPTSRPTYAVPTRLVNGTILRGQFSILNKSNIKVENLGVDVGSYWVDTFNGGSKVGGLILASIVSNIPIYNCNVNNVTILGYSAATADHCFLFENIHDSQFSNLTSYYNTHGLVFKGYNLLLDGYNGYSHGADALIIKSDTYAPSKYISANNINATSMIGYESAGIILEEGTLGTSPLEYVNLSNVNLSYTSFGIRNVNTIKNVNISNINMFNVSGNGFQFNANSTDINIGNHNLKSVTTPYAITGTSVYFNPKTDGFLASGFIPKSNGNNIFSNSAVFSDANGNVGIGTLTPTNYGGFKTFAMSGVSGSVFELMTNGTTGLQLFSDAINTTIEERRNASISLKTNGVERANISGAGVFKINNLAGTGNRTVVADASGNLSATGVGYRVYTALLTQTGTSAPVATVLENTLGGTVVWSYAATGTYDGTLAGVFTDAKTTVSLNLGQLSGTTNGKNGGHSNSINTVRLAVIDNGTASDGKLTKALVEIRVYN